MKKQTAIKELHTHRGCKVTMSSGETFLHVFTRQGFVDNIFKIIRSGGGAMETSKYGYRGKNKHIEALEDVTIMIKHVESIVDYDLQIEVAPKEDK